MTTPASSPDQSTPAQPPVVTLKAPNCLPYMEARNLKLGQSKAPEKDWYLSSSSIFEMGKFMVDEVEYSGPIPSESGRVVCKLVDVNRTVIDIRWGNYGEEGSILATYSIAH